MGLVATITLRDRLGKTSTVRLPTAKNTIAALSAAVDFYKSNSDAKVIGCGLHDDVAGDGFTEGKYDQVLQKMTLIYLDVNGTHRFSVPAPAEKNVDTYQQPEPDFAEDFKDFLVSFGSLDSATWEYMGGGLTSKMPSSELRSKDMTGV